MGYMSKREQKNSNLRLNLSFSALSMWSKGAIDSSMAIMFRLPQKRTKEMEEGLEYHKKWAEEIQRNKELFGIKFKDPKVEMEVVCRYDDFWNIKGIYDCMDGDRLYEFKSGVMGSNEYARTMQLPFYFLIAELKGLKIREGRIIHHNQKINETDLTIVFNNKERISEARNFIDTLAPEIEKYVLENNLLDKFLKK